MEQNKTEEEKIEQVKPEETKKVAPKIKIKRSATSFAIIITSITLATIIVALGVITGIFAIIRVDYSHEIKTESVYKLAYFTDGKSAFARENNNDNPFAQKQIAEIIEILNNSQKTSKLVSIFSGFDNEDEKLTKRTDNNFTTESALQSSNYTYLGLAFNNNSPYQVKESNDGTYELCPAIEGATNVITTLYILIDGDKSGWTAQTWYFSTTPLTESSKTLEKGSTHPLQFKFKTFAKYNDLIEKLDGLTA
ncbi:MAG: hypothetical protein LBM01_00405 [Christensenellaceae bacterium]|jgi:hypothetical protein|nr:hypothetical protein [Christensenellaceae bacterium]